MTTKAPQIPRLSTETWLFVCMDGPETGPSREEHLFGHLDHIEANNEHYRVAGPMRKGPGQEIVGSFFLIEADSEDDAWAIMNGDPYIASDMYASVMVHHIVPACGAWLGGVIWDQDIIRKDIQKYSR